MPISFGSGCTKNTRIMPPRISTGIISHGSASALVAGARRDKIGQRHHAGAEHNTDQRARGDEAKRQPALARQKHIGRGNAQLLAGAETHGEDDHAERQPDGAAIEHRQARNERADEREALPEQDAGLAAISVGDLADRIGDQKPADAEQATVRPARLAEPVTAMTISGPMP